MGKIGLFLREVLLELRKVTWPKRDELIGSTIVVLVFVACFAIILGVMDTACSSLLKKLMGTV